MIVFMKKYQLALHIVLLCLFCFPLTAQHNSVSARIVSVKTMSNLKGAKPDSIDLSVPSSHILTYDKNYLVFNFINAQNPRKKSFAYRLLGLDYDWIVCDDCTQAQYAHLDGGDYTFQVKANEPDAVAARFDFVIEGNIWHKWWFVPMLLLYVLLVISAVAYFFAQFQFRQKLIRQQRVHKEKIASMVELTAGIAHEIQNPLNFVNNFSELSVDIAQELNEEIKKEPLDMEYIKELMFDLTQNQVKINHHGKRASSIVKGMLEHSRTQKGLKVVTDINALVAEYFQLSYHGLQAKDKNFNATMEMYLQDALPKIEVMPQDLGRVILNLFNNAFHAVNEKNDGNTEGGYKPTVTVSTQLIDNQIVIKIKDNGIGMPESIRAKVFQPFFTTKPTGEGTGLGLSLAYDIVTKGHGGTLEVISTEGVGSEFIITLSI
jgi:signal transduction histidine kinase